MFGRDKLERRLRQERPRPDDDFLRRMTARIEADRAPSRRLSSARLGLALAVAVGALVAAGETGGLTYAGDAVGHASKSVAHSLNGSKSSSSDGSSLVSAASTEYSASGYYCFKTTMGNSYREEFISNQSDFDSFTGQGWVAARYDNGQNLHNTCNNGHIH